MSNLFKMAACCAAVIAGAISCNNEQFTVDSFASSDVLSSGGKTYSKVKISADIQTLKAGLNPEAVAAINREILRGAFNEGVMDMSVKDAYESYRDLWYSELKDSTGCYSLNDDDVYEKIIKGKFLYNDKKYVSYMLSFYDYENGGAHGMSANVPFVFNAETGAVLEEKDLFKEGYKNVVSEMLTAKAKEKAEEYVLQCEEVEANNVFYLTKDSIVYVFNPYEIAPYSSGVIEIALPLESLKDWMK